MISQHDIDAMSTPELHQYARREKECATWMNTMTPGMFAPGCLGSTVRKTFEAGWNARKKADYEALYGMTPVLAQTVKHDCCLRFDDSPNAPYLVLAENRTRYRGWNSDVSAATMMTEEEANTWQNVWEAHRTTICRQTVVHVVTDMDTPLPGLIL